MTLDHIEDFFVRSIAAMQIPGATLSVIKDDKPLIHRGAGVRRLDGPAEDNAIDVDSLFMVCSLAKAFTAASVGILVHRGQLDWTTPVVTYLPEFALSDPEITQRVTLVDLLAHRTGVVGDDDPLWVGDRGDIHAVESLLAIAPHLPLGGPFRASGFYSNFMVSVAALVVERVSGQALPDFVDANICQPLGMRDGVWSLDEFYAHPKSARMHDVITPRTDVATFAADVAYNPESPINVAAARNPDDLGDDVEAAYKAAAEIAVEFKMHPQYASQHRDYAGIGFFFSTANDMVKWGQCWANGGKSASGQQVLFELDTLTKLHNPHGSYQSDKQMRRGFRNLGFGCGWGIYQFGEYEVLLHTGGFIGAACLLAVVPSANLVVYVSETQSSFPIFSQLLLTTLHTLLPIHRADVDAYTVQRAAKLLPRAKSAMLAHQGERLRTFLGESANPFAVGAAPTPLPARWQEVCGNYAHKAFGIMSIVLDDSLDDQQLRVVRVPEANKRLYHMSAAIDADAVKALKNQVTDPTMAFFTFPGSLVLYFREVEVGKMTGPACKISTGSVWQPAKRYELVVMESVSGIEIVFGRA
ncbi:beta-lactamase/transpeptidase-like protein [Blastocladiella britannica]|nr:beta-lactamase/transpeptidase-like protein [Blastocladiella britannica]